jgi:hypothetical protein
MRKIVRIMVKRMAVKKVMRLKGRFMNSFVTEVKKGLSTQCSIGKMAGRKGRENFA